LNNHADFQKALRAKVQMPFLFGPVTFEGLNISETDRAFDYQAQREIVLTNLNTCQLMPQNVCVHGCRVRVKNRNLKRRTSLLKHSRFLRNLEVTVNPPPIKEEAQKEDGE
jgi:hypothetical protein